VSEDHDQRQRLLTMCLRLLSLPAVMAALHSCHLVRPTLGSVFFDLSARVCRCVTVSCTTSVRILEAAKVDVHPVQSMYNDAETRS